MVAICALIGILALLLAGCLTRGPEVTAFDAMADHRLATTVKHGAFLTAVRIGGRDAGPFLIDTGSDSLVLDVELAQTLPPQMFGTRQEAGYRREGAFTTTTVRDLTVGPITLRNAAIRIDDLSRVTPGFGERLAGILGYPFFASAVVEVDYLRRSVSCFDPLHYRLPHGTWQPLVLRRQLPGTTVRMDGGAEGLFVLDTGSNNAATLFAHFLARHPQLKIQNVRTQKVLYAGGERELQIGRIEWLELSGHRLDRPWVTLEKPEGPTPEIVEWFDGIVGEEALRHFLVVLNYPAGKIALLPPATFGPVSQWNVRPPSTARAAPVTKEDSSLVR